ncbi:MAG: HEAT repeat domain-containing protein [Planctomycetes bacterium]|nr:HEAT repeat domain-containing protein [Planctomycetota bacterium]
MARLAFKPDSSFFRKIAMGAVGSRAVCADLHKLGHRMAELERGSTDTKLWKDVKRKRVRIPDLVCTRCGLRIESRAKTSPELSMSHSPAEEARAWDFGMVDRDLIAFPVCEAAEETYWSTGRLSSVLSYWHERNWVRWQPKECINYFEVRAFRATPHLKSSTKGVTEGSETSISWGATFSSRTGVVEVVADDRITIRRTSDDHRHTWRLGSGVKPAVQTGETVLENQVIACAVEPIPRQTLRCQGELPNDAIGEMLSSRERTLRFTGVKLARLRHDPGFEAQVRDIAADQDEDASIRLEGASYLTAVCGSRLQQLFSPYLCSADPQTQLEAVIAAGEAGTPEAVEVLGQVIDAVDCPFFLRTAAAWSLGKVASPEAVNRLIRAFADVDHGIRQEALDGIISIGGPAIPLLLLGLREADDSIAAGCAESLRQLPELPDEVVSTVVSDLKTGASSPWATWLVGMLPRERVASAVADLQSSAPDLHYAVSLLWSFVESWISRRWETQSLPPQEKLRGI